MLCILSELGTSTASPSGSTWDQTSEGETLQKDQRNQPLEQELKNKITISSSGHAVVNYIGLEDKIILLALSRWNELGTVHIKKTRQLPFA